MGAIFDDIRKLLAPPRWDTWQTLIWISVFSWAVSLLTLDNVQAVISSIGWIFLIAGTHWALHDPPIKKSLTFNKFFIGPWITGALVCIFLFGTIFDSPPSVALISWPVISAIIAALPKFVSRGPDGPEYKAPPPPDRQYLIILVLCNLILSCWIQLYFATQSWLEEYPSLLADDMSQSAFVFRLSSEDRTRSRGFAVLDQATSVIREKLSGQPWPQVERWLLDLNREMVTVQQDVMQRLPDVGENSLWRLGGRILPGQEYQMQINAMWQGPTADGAGYYLSRTCRITRSENRLFPIRTEASSSPGTTAVPREQKATVDCGPISGPTNGQPELTLR